MHLDVCLIIEMCASRFGLGFTHDAIYIFARHMFMHISCILILSFSLFLVVMSLSLSDRLRMAPKRKSTLARNSLGFGSSSSDPLIPLFMFGSVMGRPNRTSLKNFRNMAFIWNTMLFYQTFPTFLSLRSFGLRAKNLFMRDPWFVPSCLYRSFTPINMVSIPLYLGLPRHFEVHVL